MYVELGKVVGVWGVKGWIKLHSYTRSRADIANYKTWYLSPPSRKQDSCVDESRTAVEVVSCREQGPGVVAQLNGVADRDQAVALNGHVIWIKQNDLPILPQGEYYWHQLIGLKVSNSESQIGHVTSIMETGANDVLVVEQKMGQAPQSPIDVLIPYTDDVVENVDLTQGTMLVDWDPSYLLD